VGVDWMDMGGIIGDSFKYPFSNWQRFLTFGLLVTVYALLFEIISRNFVSSPLFGLLVFPAIISYFFMMGYQLRAIRNTIIGESELPAYNRWLGMFLDGLRMFFAELIYGILPGIILVLGFVLMVSGSSSNPILGLLLLLLGVVVLIVFVTISVIAISNMAYYNEFGAAFRFDEILEKIKSIGWFNLILILIVLGIIEFLLALVGALLSLIPAYLGLIISSLIVNSFIYLFSSRAYGLIYKNTIVDETEEHMDIEKPSLNK
jgi:hypothetical protein